MFIKIKSWVVTFVKSNIMFFFGMVFGSVIATITTVLITMGFMGIPETLGLYQQMICGVM